MLTLQDTQNPIAIENHFCKPFDNLQKEPMSKDVAEMLIKIYTSNVSEEHQKEALEKIFGVAVLAKRVEHCFTYTIDFKTNFFLNYLVESNPGMLVMYATYLQYKCKKIEIVNLTFDIFCEKIFPMGFPSKKDLSQLWDQQKINRYGAGGSDNLVDYYSTAGISIN